MNNPHGNLFVSDRNFKKYTLILNSNMVMMLMAFKKNEWLLMTKSFAPCMFDAMPSNPYLHAIHFLSEEDRNEAYDLLCDYAKTKLGYPFCYKGERVNAEMMEELKANRGNFTIWKNIEY